MTEIEPQVKVEKRQTRKPLVFKDFYPINPPFGYSGIEILDEKGKMDYVTLEPNLKEEESLVLDEIRDLIISSQDIQLYVLDNPEEMRDYLKDKIQVVFRKNEKKINRDCEDKLMYYLFRDFMGYGKMDLLMKDPFIEDISCNGQESPIYIWHTIHESMPTNVIYGSSEELSKTITRLVY